MVTAVVFAGLVVDDKTTAVVEFILIVVLMGTIAAVELDLVIDSTAIEVL